MDPDYDKKQSDEVSDDPDIGSYKVNYNDDTHGFDWSNFKDEHCRDFINTDHF